MLSAVTEGVPSLGAGAIYPIPLDEVLVDPFPIPKHWRRAYGLDVGWNRCLAKDTMVLLPDGTQKPIQDMRVGDDVLAFDFNTENLVPTKVVDTFHGYARNMVTVGISKEQTLTCTDDHPFAHRAQCHDVIRFKNIKDINNRIREFQSVVLPSRWDVQDEIDVCSAEMARILGYLLGDGCLTYTNSRIEFSQTIQVYIDDMRACLAHVGCKMRSYESNRKHFLSGVIYGKNSVLDFIRKLGLLGKNSSTKFIPPVFFRASKEIIKNLLVGLIHTDGSIEGDNVRYYTVSERMAEGVKLLCLRLGIYASVSRDSRKKKVTHNDVFRVTLRRPYSLPLLAPKELVPTRPERKRRSDRLLTIYEDAPPQDIHCITVGHPDHAFICNGFVVSNTAAVWGAIDSDSDVLFLYTEHYRAHAEPSIHATAIKARGAWIPGVIDPAARGASQRDGSRLIIEYQELGLNLMMAEKSASAGIHAVWDRLATGRLRVFRSMRNWQAEYRIYHRTTEGKVVKVNDHLLDGTRYLVISGLDIAIVKPQDVFRQPVSQLARLTRAGY